MKRIEDDFSNALSQYLEARNRLENIREKLNSSSISKNAEERLASLVARYYSCIWYRTNQGSIAFTDALDNIRENRRDDAQRFWRRTVLGLKS